MHFFIDLQGEFGRTQGAVEVAFGLENQADIGRRKTEVR